MKIQELIDNLKDGPTTTLAIVGLVAAFIDYFNQMVAAAVKGLTDLGYAPAPDQLTWLKFAVGALCVKMMFFEGKRK